MSSSGDAVRERVSAALPWLASDPASARHLSRWLATAPRIAAVTATATLDRVRLDGLDSWVAVDRDGADDGWREPGDRPIEEAVGRAPEHPAGPRLLGWAVDHGLATGRAVHGSTRRGWTEFRVPLPAWPADRTLAAVRDAFTRLDVKWLGDQVSLALSVGTFGDGELVAAWSRDGVQRLGVHFTDPPLDLHLRLARALLVRDDARLDDLEDVLGAEPSGLACTRRGASVDLELDWQTPARPLAAALPPDDSGNEPAG
jgi:hypothetical protein